MGGHCGSYNQSNEKLKEVNREGKGERNTEYISKGKMIEVKNYSDKEVKRVVRL